MTDVVVTGAGNTVVYGTQIPNTIITGMMGPPGISELHKLLDVDARATEEGTVLVYSSVTNKWEATRLLNNQNIDCGEF